jgi:hypothetical protein
MRIFCALQVYGLAGIIAFICILFLFKKYGRFNHDVSFSGRFAHCPRGPRSLHARHGSQGPFSGMIQGEGKYVYCDMQTFSVKHLRSLENCCRIYLRIGVSTVLRIASTVPSHHRDYAFKIKLGPQRLRLLRRQ